MVKKQQNVPLFGAAISVPKTTNGYGRTNFQINNVYILAVSGGFPVFFLTFFPVLHPNILVFPPDPAINNPKNTKKENILYILAVCVPHVHVVIV